MSRKYLKVILLLLSTLCLLPSTQVLSRVGDEGTIIYGAQRVFEGAIPGRDFVEVMGPGAFYWLALFFKLFGTGWQVTRLYLLLTGVTTVMLLHDIASRVCRDSVAIVLWLFVLIIGVPIWPAVSQHWDSNLFAILALWCFLRFETSGRMIGAGASGVLACITATVMPEKGCLLLLAFLATFAVGRRSREAILVAGSFALTGIVVLATFWRAGALRDLFNANVLWPLTSYHGVNGVPYGDFFLSAAAVPALKAIGANWLGYVGASVSLVPFLVIAGLPLLLSTSLAARLFSVETRRQLLAGPMPIIVLAGTALWMSEIHRRDIFHLVYGSPLLLIALFASAQPVLRRGVIGAMAASLLVFGSVNLVAHQHGSKLIETRRGTIRSVMNNDALQFLSTAVKPRERVFVYPYYSMYYYLADVANPTRFSLLMYNYNTPDQFNEVIQNLEQKQVRYVLWDTEVYGEKLVAWFPDYRHPEPGQLKLERYLQQHFDLIGVKSGFRVLRRHLLPS